MKKPQKFKSQGAGPKFRRKQKLVLLFLFVLLLFFLGNGIWRTVRFSQFLNKPISKSSTILDKFSQKGSLWDGKMKVNIAIASEPILVVSVDQKEKTVKILAIPVDTYTQVPGGYGWYRVGAAYGLGELESPPAGGALFAKTISQMVGVPIDYYLKFKRIELSSLDFEKLSKLRGEFLGISAPVKAFKAAKWVSDNLDTNFTLFDIYKAWWKSNSLRFSKDNYLDLTQDYLEEIVLADGSRGFIPKKGRFEILVAKVFGDPNIAKEGLAIAVYNASGKEGAGDKVKSLLENLGGQVIEVKNLSPLAPKSKLTIAGKVGDNSYTVTRLTRVFDLEVEKLKEDQESDLVLTLGEDWQ